MVHVRGIQSPHLWAYAGDDLVCSMRVWAEEGKEAEVKKDIDALLNDVGLKEHTVDVVSDGNADEFYLVKGGNDVSSVISRFQHHHDHSHHHHSDMHEHCSSSDESDSDDSHHHHEHVDHYMDHHADHHSDQETTSIRLSHNHKETKLLISQGKLY